MRRLEELSSFADFFPMWFEVVAGKTSSEAGWLFSTLFLRFLMLRLGLHLFPNSISMSAGSLFAGCVLSPAPLRPVPLNYCDLIRYMMHRTGRYKTLNLVFGILPFIASLLIARLKPDSAAITQWLSIVSSLMPGS